MAMPGRLAREEVIPVAALLCSPGGPSTTVHSHQHSERWNPGQRIHPGKPVSLFISGFSFFRMAGVASLLMVACSGSQLLHSKWVAESTFLFTETVLRRKCSLG